VELETWKSVKAEVYFKTCLGKNGKSREIFGRSKDSYCSIFFYSIHYSFLNHFKPVIRVHIICICTWGFYLFKWRTLKKKVKIVENYKLRIYWCVQYLSLRILEEMLLCTIGVELHCMFDQLWCVICLTEGSKLTDNIQTLLGICWWNTWKAYNI